MSLKKAVMPNEILSKANLIPSDYKALAKKELHPKIAQMREEETKLVTGTFRCMEPLGGSVTLSYRKYPGEPIGKYTFEDGKTYTIPLGLARHLNSGCAWPVYKHELNNNTSQLDQIPGKWVKRFSFMSTEYSDPLSLVKG